MRCPNCDVILVNKNKCDECNWSSSKEQQPRTVIEFKYGDLKRLMPFQSWNESKADYVHRCNFNAARFSAMKQAEQQYIEGAVANGFKYNGQRYVDFVRDYEEFKVMNAMSPKERINYIKSMYAAMDESTGAMPNRLSREEGEKRRDEFFNKLASGQEQQEETEQSNPQELNASNPESEYEQFMANQ